MNNKTIRQVVILGALAIIGIMAVQTYWVLKTWDIKEKEFHQTINIALLNVAKGLAEINGNVLPTNNLINQRSSNYYVVNFNDEIDANLLEYYLQKEFEALALATDFEYGIYDCSSDKIMYGNYVSLSNAEKKINVKEDLPKYEGLDYYFGVRFPNKTGYVIGSMHIVAVFTILLISTVLFFVYAMFIILRQKRLSEMQKDFINNMTHEFKTPISTIKISSDVFLKDEQVQSDKRLHRYANIIKEQNQRLNNQVEKVLQLARIESDSFKLNQEELNLHQLIKNVVRSNELKVFEKNGVINSHLNSATVSVNADKLHLTNILHNIIDNAIKYCRVEPEIIVKTTETEDEIILSVEDNGIGISKNQQAKVFNKFYRVPTGNVHNVKGFGLGLFYIKNICEAHGWKLNLESEPAHGTTISIHINKPKAKQEFAFSIRKLISELFGKRPVNTSES